MEFVLDKALKEMYIDDDEKLHVLKNLPEVQFGGEERKNYHGQVAQFLCPEDVKHDSRLTKAFERVYERALGIVFFSISIDFNLSLIPKVIFRWSWIQELGSTMIGVMVLERWVKQPQDDYLSILLIWIRLKNSPVNHYTTETIEEIRELVGHVTVVAFDPSKPQSRGCVDVRILLEVTKPLKNMKPVGIRLCSMTCSTLMISREFWLHLPK